MNLPFGTGSYQRAEDRLPQARLINMFVEKAPTSQTGVVLLGRPGLLEYLDPPGTCRGLYKQSGVMSGSLLSVNGSMVYQEDTVLGTVAGADRVQWAYSVDGLRLLADGVIYVVTASGLTADPFVDNAGVASIASVNNILVAIREDTQKVYYRLPGDTTWGALDYTSAEAEPDNAVGLVETRGELWVFGESSIEIFYPTDLVDQPLQRADGRKIQRGCKSRDSIAKLDNTLFWVGEDNNAYRAAEVPEVISNPAISERISGSASASAWSYSLDGHTFYVLSLDTECLAYDVSTGEWHQLRRSGQSGFVKAGLFDGTTTYLGDEKIWTFDRDLVEDDGDELERLFTSFAPTQQPISANALDVLVSPGTAPLGVDCALETRWSNDQGRTWSVWQSADLGSEGAYRTRARIRRLGMIDAPGRVFEHRITDPAQVRISGVDLNPSTGGRSR